MTNGPKTPMWILALVTLGLAAAGGGVLPGTAAPAAGLTALLWAWLALRSRRLPWQASEKSVKSFVTVAWMGIAVLVFLVLTAIPLPDGIPLWHGILRRHQNDEVLQRLELAARLGLISAPARRFALSRNLAGTLRVVILVAGMLSSGMLAAWMGPVARRRHLRFLMLLGSGIAVAGYVSQYLIPQGDTLWWTIPVPPSLPGPVACFVNRNHYGGFLALLAAPALILTCDDLVARRRRWGIPMLAASALMVTALVASQSRGALLAWIGGMIIGGLHYWGSRHLSAKSQRRLLRLLIVPLSVGLLLSAAVWLAPAPARERLDQTLRHPLASGSVQSRVEAWHETVLVWRGYPWIGAGANALRMVYPQHRLSTHRETRTHAENQYLQILAETGIVGVILSIGLMIVLMREALAKPFFDAVGPESDPPAIMVNVRFSNGGATSVSSAGGFARASRVLFAPGNRGEGVPRAGSSRQTTDPVFVSVAVSALAVAAIHALIDFPHHVPLYGMVMAILIGIGFPWPPRIRDRTGAAAWGPAVLCLAAVLFAVPAGRLKYTRDDPVRIPEADMTELMHMLTWSPTSWQVWYEFGRRAWSDGRPEAVRLGEDAISRAAELDPNNYQLWYEVGRARLRIGDRAGARAAFQRVRELRHWVRVPVVEP